MKETQATINSSQMFNFDLILSQMTQAKDEKKEQEDRDEQKEVKKYARDKIREYNSIFTVVLHNNTALETSFTEQSIGSRKSKRKNQRKEGRRTQSMMKLLISQSKRRLNRRLPNLKEVEERQQSRKTLDTSLLLRSKKKSGIPRLCSQRVQVNLSRIFIGIIVTYLELP